MKSSNVQIIVIGVFIVFIIAAVIIFSMSRSTNSDQANQNAKVVIWGTIPEEKFNPTVDRANTVTPGIINLSYDYKDPYTLQSDLTAALLDGKGAPDGLLIPHSLLIALQKRLTLIAWTAVSERDLKNNYAEAGEIFFTPTGTYAIPFLIDPLVLYWNRDIFNSQGITNPPGQWQELEGLATRFTELNENKTVRKSMIALGEYQNVPHAKAILSALAFQVGARFLSWSGEQLALEMQLKPEGFEENPHESALLYFAQFSNPNNPLYSWTRAMPNAEQYFLQGDSAMYIGFGSEAQDLRAKNPNLNFDIALLPQAKSAERKTTYGEVYGLAIVNASIHKQAMLNVALQLTGSALQSDFAQTATMAPVRRDLLGNPPGTSITSAIWRSALWAKGWLDPNPALTEAYYQAMIESVTTGRSKVQEAFITMYSRVKELIDAFNK